MVNMSSKREQRRRWKQPQHWYVWTPAGAYEAQGPGIPLLYEIGHRAGGCMAIENDLDWHARQPVGRREIPWLT